MRKNRHGRFKKLKLPSSSNQFCRTKRRPARKATAIPLVSSAVEQRLRKLQKFYQGGQAIRRQNKTRIRWAEMGNDAATSSKAELLRKARAFANPQVGYSPQQLQQLCQMCRKHGFALGVAEVIRLLSVPDRRQRDHLQRQAIEGHWTNERLVAEIRMRLPRSKRWAGKHVRTPHDVGEALYRLGWDCNRWNGLHEALGRKPDDSGKPVKGSLPPMVRDRLVSADAAIKSLHDAVLNQLPLKKC